ncbi:MAG: hypothetical protein FWG45_07605 [Oscillospiraceae bacterium]|nr:hypothetical protein [Oscillospiraceae bacterium]
MDINKISSNAVNSYNRVMKYTKPADTLEAKVSSGKVGTFDTVEIDFARTMAKAKADLSAKLEAELAADYEARVQSLKTAYADEVCPVPADSVAMAILGL